MTDLNQIVALQTALDTKTAMLNASIDAFNQKSAKLDTDIKTHADTLEKMAKEKAEIELRLGDAEQKLADGIKAGTKSIVGIAQQFVDDPRFVKYVDGGGLGNLSIRLKNTILSPVADVQPQYTGIVVSPALQSNFVRDLLMQGSMSGEVIHYTAEKSNDNQAGPVEPATLKPQSSIEWEPRTASAVTMAHWVKAGKQVLSDKPQLISIIQQRLLYMLRIKTDAEILNGTGAANRMQGLMHMGNYTDLDDALFLPDDNMADRLQIALSQIQNAFYPTDGLILNPLDWTKIVRSKDKQGRYLFDQAMDAIWNTKVVTNAGVSQGTFMGGAFKVAAQYWAREDATVQISSENADDFIHNLVTILVEERGTSAVYVPKAIVKGTFV